MANRLSKGKVLVGAVSVPAGGMYIAGTQVTATANEINTGTVAGLTSTAAELNTLHSVVAGTTSASKALVVDANKALDVLALPVSGLKIGAGAGTAVSATAAELNKNTGVTAGTATAFKTAVLGATKNLDVLALPVSGLMIGAPASEVAVDTTAAELNANAGVTAGTASASKTVVLDSNKQIGGMKKKVTAAAGDGAIVISDGIVNITKGSAAALTLADPASGDAGTILIITSQTAFAHTVSNAAGSGFNAGGGASDVGTFGGAIGDGFAVVAINTKWNVLYAKNVTLG